MSDIQLSQQYAASSGYAMCATSDVRDIGDFTSVQISGGVSRCGRRTAVESLYRMGNLDAALGRASKIYGVSPKPSIPRRTLTDETRSESRSTCERCPVCRKRHPLRIELAWYKYPCQFDNLDENGGTISIEVCTLREARFRIATNAHGKQQCLPLGSRIHKDLQDGSRHHSHDDRTSYAP
ncbi:hypothetical protein M8818_005826 [Zalaria obscura]|uniref:Uncharacterized protein n=1 Tax=Zalaria obscura TaxID=2024903 RepID=A0ACC3S9H5_9PEZI